MKQDLIIKKPNAINKGGKPLAYPDPLEFERKVNQYFNWCDSQTKTTAKGTTREKTIYKPYTITGLCVFLEIDRETLGNYGKRSGYIDTVKNAKTRIENWIEEMAMNGLINPTFGMFSLKSNFGWIEKSEVKFSGNLALTSVLKEIKGDAY